MKFSELKKILLRLFKFYVKKHLFKLFISVLLSLVVAGSTGAIAWLLDPAIKKIFIDQDQTMMLLIPIAIALSFTIKGGSLYAARNILPLTSNPVCSFGVKSGKTSNYSKCHKFLHYFYI